MFGRWVQENDFKYLDKHFGINQITSYGVTGYDELRQQVEDRQVRSVEVKALQEQRRQNRTRQSRLLLLQSQGEHQESQRQQRIQELELQAQRDSAKMELARLRQGQSRWTQHAWGASGADPKAQRRAGAIGGSRPRRRNRPSRAWND